MAGENVVGSVQIVITGDTSRLQADFANAAQMAQRAGGTVAANFNAGVAPGMRSALVAVENFGKGFQSVASSSGSAAEALIAELNELDSAIDASAVHSATAAQGQAAWTAAMNATGQAAAAATPPVAALGGAGGGAAGGLNQVAAGAAGASNAVNTLNSSAGRATIGMFQLYAAVRLLARVFEELDKFRESEEKLSHLSAATGIAAERIAAFGGAVNLAGGDADKTGATIDRLARAMEAAKESGGAVADDLKRLGVAGEGLKDPIEALYQIADTVHNTSDKFAALEAAERVTGRSSSDLIGILGEGRAALEANAAASKDYASALAGAIGPSHELTVAENQLKQALATVAGESMPAVVAAVKFVASAFEASLLQPKIWIDTIIYGFLSVSHTLQAQGTVIGDVLKGTWSRINDDASAGMAILRSDLNKFTSDVKKDVDETKAFIDKLNAPVAAPTPGAGKPFAPPGDIGNKVAVAEIDAEIAALKRKESEQTRSDDLDIEGAKLVANARIEAMHDPTARAIALANQEVQVAKDKAAAITRIEADAQKEIALIRQKGAAEQSGKSPVEQRVIQIKTQSDISAVEDQTRSTADTLRKNVIIAEDKAQVSGVEAVRKVTLELQAENEKLFDELGKGWTQAEERVLRYNEVVAQRQTKTYEAEDQYAGAVQGLKIDQQKLETERAYGLAVSRTRQDEIAYLTRIAALENAAREAKISGLQNKLGELGPTITPGPTNSEEEASRAEQQARIQGQIAQLQQEAANANIAAQTKIAEQMQKQNDLLQAQITLAQTLTNWSQIGIGAAAKDFASAAVQLPGQIGNSLASSIVEAPKKGESKVDEIGKGLESALKNAGKQLLGNLITQAIEKLISELIGQAAVAALQTSSQAANTTAVAANTVAVAANTAALAASGTASAAGGVAAGAGGAASAAGSVAGGAATGFIGPLISAAGGIIGGIISSITTWAGDAKIVAAVNGTTAAVNALGQRLGPEASTGTGATASSSSSSLQAPTNAGSFNPLVNLLNGITGAGAMRVNVVAISPIAPLAGLFSLFGFADGGTPAIGVPALGGERGPEIGVSHATGAMSMIGARGPQIFTPREKMSIVPNHLAGAFLASRGMKGYADGAALRMIPPMTEHTMLKGYAEGTSDVSTSMTSSHAVNIGSMHFAAHGITDPDRFVDHVARKLPGVLKTRLPRLSPAAR